jgi:hypothetical protein
MHQDQFTFKFFSRGNYIFASSWEQISMKPNKIMRSNFSHHKNLLNCEALAMVIWIDSLHIPKKVSC